jgi:class 3 adenylate cyclase/tetratricopeptide (TPR) repeat protein
MPPQPADPDPQVQRLEAAIAAQEDLRPTLGDAVVDAAVAALRGSLAALRAASGPESTAPAGPEPPPAGPYTVLFADLAGFTAISEALDPDDVREFLNDLMLELSDAVEQHDGLVVKFLGDAVVAAFHGVPGGGGAEDVARGLRAALLIEARGRELDAEWRGRLGRPVELHMGLEAGGLRGGTESLHDEAIAAATRLHHRAAAGQVLVGPEAFACTRDAFRYAPAPGGAGGDAFLLLGEVGGRPADSGSSRAAGQPGGAPPPPPGEAELRRATVVFADLAEPGRVRASLSSHDLAAFQQDLTHALTEAATRYGGSVERLFGNAVMALFGAPVAHEDDPERALRCAALMRELAANLDRRWGSRVGNEIALQIGINTGTVVAGGILLGSGRTYAVTGDTLNTAARLRSAAGPGEILLGADTRRFVAHTADLEPIPPLVLKGKARPVQAYRLRALRATGGSTRGLQQRGIASELVGRGPEIAALREALARLRQGRGGVLVVTGEPGLGKSRLLAEARSLPEAAEVLWLEGRTLSYSTDLSYWPFLQVLRQAAGIREGDPESAAWAGLEERLRSLFGADIDEPLVYLATMLGLEITGELAERVRYLDAEAVRRQVFRTARRFFEALARERPLVLLIEDLHWVDASSAALVEHLLPLTAEAPLLLCWASRPEAAVARRLAEAARADPERHFAEIALQPLPRDAGDELLRGLLGDALPPALRRAILDKADGNPFFVEEVIRGMIDAGAVVHERGVWRASPEAEAMTIPDTVQGVIMARIDRLDDDLKRTLRLASVVGRSFFMRVLKSIAEAEHAIEEGVSELAELELLRRKGAAPELEYMFRHVLVQETAYESIVKRRRRELHRRVCAAIEGLFADRLDEFHGLLAYHAARGEDWDRAQRYLLRAGDQAARLAADQEALAHYQQAVEVCERALGDRWDPRERAALDRRIGEALYRRGEFTEATQFLTAALGRLGRAYPRSRAGVRRGIARHLARQFGRRQTPWLLRRGSEADTTARECGEIYLLLAWIDYTLDQERLVLDALASLNEAEQAGDPVGTSRGMMAVGLLFGATGLHGLAGRYHAEGVRLGRQHRQPVALGQAYLGLGIHRYDTGDWDGCRSAMEQSRTTYLEAGDLRGWGAASAWIFWMDVYRGDFAAALETAEQMARYGQETADGQLARFGLHYRGAALSRSGDLAAAVANLERAVALYRGVPEVIGMAHAAGDLGLCHARLGDLPRALEVLEEANRELDERRLNAGGCVPPRAALAEALTLAAEAAAGEDRRRLLDRARRAAAACLQLGRLHHESLIFGHRTAATCAWLQGRPKAARAGWRRALALAERLGARYEAARLHQLIGRLTGEDLALARAEELFAEIGAGWELERTRALRSGG